MKLAIMQPYFFPYIGYWQLIHAVDRFVIYDDVNFIKGGWINRNRILINGKPCYITAPLHQSSSYKHICDISLQPSFLWRDKLVKMVETTYRKAPFFSEVFPTIEKLIRYEADNLSDYLSYQLQTLARFMFINTKFVLSSHLYQNNGLTGQDRVLDICKRENATTYINPQGGQSLYSQDAFAHCDVNLKFLLPLTVNYKQFGVKSESRLSIIDVLIFNGIDGTRKLLDEYSIVTSCK